MSYVISFIILNLSLQILKVLEVIDDEKVYTYNMVLSSEAEVFKTVGFKVPLNTPLIYVEVLLAIVNRHDETDREIALLLLDIAFLQVYIPFVCYNYFAKKKKEKEKHAKYRILSI